MANKLNVVKGIIQDATVAGYPIHQRIVAPKGGKNVRTLLKITPDALCYHNTANTSPTADDLNHARYLQNLENADKTYLSVHFFVDQDSITQCIPIDEMAYHAGTTIGNKTSIAIEICENGDIAKAEKIAQELGASLLLTYPKLAIKKHQDYSGKYCPKVILSRNGWSQFVQDIIALTKPVQPVAPAPAPQPVGNSYQVRITAGLLNYRKGPGVGYGINGTVKRNEIYTIVEVKNGWGRLKSGAGWINLKYTTKHS